MALTARGRKQDVTHRITSAHDRRLDRLEAEMRSVKKYLGGKLAKELRRLAGRK